MLSGSNGKVQTGTSYIRWGRKICEGNASLVYTGNNNNIHKQQYHTFISFIVPAILWNVKQYVLVTVTVLFNSLYLTTNS